MLVLGVSLSLIKLKGCPCFLKHKTLLSTGWFQEPAPACRMNMKVTCCRLRK